MEEKQEYRVTIVKDSFAELLEEVDGVILSARRISRLVNEMAGADAEILKRLETARQSLGKAVLAIGLLQRSGKAKDDSV